VNKVFVSQYFTPTFAIFNFIPHSFWVKMHYYTIWQTRETAILHQLR
jgi:hypothetical protein